MRISFGQCVFDNESRELLRGDRRVPLAGKAFELLDLLIGERPRALSKSEIFDRLWPETFVTEATLTTLVHHVRQAVGDDAGSHQFLRTVHGFGYAFCGEAVDLAGTRHGSHAGRHRRLVYGNVDLVLTEGDNVIGRSRGATITIDSPTLSRRHARILVRSDAAILEDLGSHYGTHLNEEEVRLPVHLSDGDQIRMGSVRLTFRILADLADPIESTET